MVIKASCFRIETELSSLRVSMKRNILFCDMEEHKKLESLPFTDP